MTCSQHLVASLSKYELDTAQPKLVLMSGGAVVSAKEALNWGSKILHNVCAHPNVGRQKHVHILTG